MKQISIEDFYQLWKSAKDSGTSILIDVRTPVEYAQGHVPGAQLLSLATLDGRVHEIPKDKDVYLLKRPGRCC